jgi:uncharacterized protein YjiS (DUF1127 family)
MDTDLNSAATRLATGSVLRIDNSKGQSIAVIKGMVWITQEGDRRDAFLSDGDTFVFDRAGTALVQALSETRLLAFVDETATLIENLACSSPAEQSVSDVEHPLRAIANTVQRWLWRSNARYELAGVGERRLRDLGLRGDVVRIEHPKAFWSA